ncbi:TetR family transcriptional regulator [Acuticoccus sp.]|uniref:TetR family transcriptional regulator n=1 Tax=Acuticoccus sp. TaxID=1904378 RepID=UPI003B5170BF
MSPRDRIIDATFGLIGERPFDRVTLQAIADAAGVSLAALASEFPTRGHILDAFVRRIDDEVLAGEYGDMADEAPRERLFDVLMARLDALRPHRAAIRSLARSARADPALGLALNGMAVRSQAWMLAAAGIGIGGWRGRLAAQGLAVAFARVLRVFVEEDDPGLPRTMAALDRELRRAEERHGRFARWFGPAVQPRAAASAADVPFPEEAMPAAAAEPLDPTVPPRADPAAGTSPAAPADVLAPAAATSVEDGQELPASVDATLSPADRPPAAAPNTTVDTAEEPDDDGATGGDPSRA